MKSLIIDFHKCRKFRLVKKNQFYKCSFLFFTFTIIKHHTHWDLMENIYNELELKREMPKNIYDFIKDLVGK